MHIPNQTWANTCECIPDCVQTGASVWGACDTRPNTHDHDNCQSRKIDAKKEWVCPYLFFTFVGLTRAATQCRRVFDKHVHSHSAYSYDWDALLSRAPNTRDLRRLAPKAIKIDYISLAFVRDIVYVPTASPPRNGERVNRGSGARGCVCRSDGWRILDVCKFDLFSVVFGHAHAHNDSPRPRDLPMSTSTMTWPAVGGRRGRARGYNAWAFFFARYCSPVRHFGSMAVSLSPGVEGASARETAIRVRGDGRGLWLRSRLGAHFYYINLSNCVPSYVSVGPRVVRESPCTYVTFRVLARCPSKITGKVTSMVS